VKRLFAAVSATMCAGAALGANFIRQWNSAIDPSKYTISQVQRTITIHAGDTETFKFEAFDDVTGDPGDIDAIVIDQDGAGPVNLMVFGDPSAGRLDGARHVKKIDLSNTLSGTLVQLRIAGDLGENGGALIPDDVTGSVLIAGDLLDGFSATNITSGYIVNGDLNGRILIDGALHNGTGDEIEIEGALGSPTAAIAVNYDGRSDSDDDWDSGATVVVDSTPYTGNTPAARIWNVSRCKGDMNGDRNVGSLDGSPSSSGSPYYVARFDPEQCEADFPGLEGSRCWHGDCNFSANPLNPEDCGYEATDDAAFVNLVEHACCLSDGQALWAGDVDHVCQVGLADLSALLTNYGTASGATRAQGDLDGDGDVELANLSALLTVYGTECCPADAPPTPSEGDATIRVVAFDTGSYTTSGFAGESTHFVFDVLIELDQAADDWTGCGAAVKRASGATFYVISGASNPPTPGSSQPGRHRSFFSVPYAVTASNRFNAPFPSGGIVGAYSPLGSSYVYSTTDINANWYDTTGSSNDGPAAVLPVTIDVSGVGGADVSGGFGSVYFSTTGLIDGSDIKVADLAAALAHAYDQGEPQTLTGAFYVNGE